MAICKRVSKLNNHIYCIKQRQTTNSMRIFYNLLTCTELDLSGNMC